jgi:hypothetical protein
VQVHVDLPQETFKLLQGDLAFGDASKVYPLLEHCVREEPELLSIT